MRRSRQRYLALGLSTIVVVACHDGPTTPEPDAFDAATTQAHLDAMNAVVTTGSWESFETLGPRFPIGGAVASLGRAAGAAVRGDHDAAAGAIGGLAMEIARAPRIPPEIRGTTFVLDPETLQYVADSERDGAPANGVRFILYAVNPISKQPIADREIGHADLTDAGDELETGVAVRLEVVSDGVTFLDYAVSAVGAESTGTLTVVGFTTDGETRLEFDVSATGTQTEGGATSDVAFHLAIPARDFAARDFAARGSVRGAVSAAGPSTEVALTIEVGDTDITFTAHGTPTAVDAEFRVNGNLLASVRGDPANPEIRGAGGRALRPEEREALHHVMQVTGLVFRMFAHLMQPVGGLLGFHPPH